MKTIIILFFIIVLQQTLTAQCGSIQLNSQQDVDQFPLMNCDSIAGDLEIKGYSINNLNALMGLKYVSGNITIDSTNIAQVSGLQTLDYAYSIQLLNCPLLDDISSLENIGTLQDLIVEECDNIESIIFDEINLTTGIYAIGNDALSIVSIEIDSNIAEFAWVEISYNPQLESFHGLSNIQEIHTMKITHNAELHTVDAFDHLFILNTTHITHNSSLTEVTFLHQVILHGVPTPTEFHISHNNILNRIHLPKMKAVGNFFIEYNPQLDYCCFLADFIRRGGNFQLISLNVNGDQCDILSDILRSCEDLDPDNDFIVAEFDNCPTVSNEDQLDWDNDGIGNSCDNCPSIANPDQADADNNFIGDICDNGTPKIGINTSDPQSALQLENGDIYIKEASRGIIVSTHLGFCYRINIDENGVLRTTRISCP